MLFWLLFLSGISTPGVGAAPLPFDASREMAGILFFDAPAILLLLYLAKTTARRPVEWLRGPKRIDLLVAAAASVALALVAAGIGLIAAAVEGAPPNFLARPGDPLGWTAAAATCLSTGYLEEVFFRAYLRDRLRDAGIDGPRAIAVSVSLFAVCHLYEGPWGLLNALCAALLLTAAFAFRRSVHAPAWAHGAYNLFAYVMR